MPPGCIQNLMQEHELEDAKTSRPEIIRAWLKKNVTPDRQMSMITDPPPASRLELVRVWLEDNVRVPETPKEIAISDIEFTWEDLRGSFRLALDNCTLKDRFHLSIDIAGRVKFTPPMVHSPLGAPASYAIVEIDRATSEAVIRALEKVFPRIRGYGLYEDLGLDIWGDSPLESRIIDQMQFLRMKKALEKVGLQVAEKV